MTQRTAQNLHTTT